MQWPSSDAMRYFRAAKRAPREPTERNRKGWPAAPTSVSAFVSVDRLMIPENVYPNSAVSRHRRRAWLTLIDHRAAMIESQWQLVFASPPFPFDRRFDPREALQTVCCLEIRWSKGFLSLPSQMRWQVAISVGSYLECYCAAASRCVICHARLRWSFFIRKQNVCIAKRRVASSKRFTQILKTFEHRKWFPTTNREREIIRDII